jgi:dimethylargininase
MSIALVRAVPESLAHCELTHLARVPIDVTRAAKQHQHYEDTLRRLGCTVRHLPATPDLPDSVFVEDVAVVLDEMAIITRPGAASRRPERESIATVLSEYRPLRAIQPPGTLDGGDVLRVGRTLFVGLSTRTNEDGAGQLARYTAPFGYTIRYVQTTACLHLKSAATALDGDRLLCNPEWIDTAVFGESDTLAIDPDEPHAANVLRLGDTIICAAAHERTAAALQSSGYRVVTVDVSELAKAEAGVTCCSVIVEGR